MTMFRDDDRIIFRRPNLVFRIATPGVGRQLLIQDGPLGYRLMLLSSTYMRNCVIASTNISPLKDFCTGHLGVTGKRMSPVRSRILPSLILFKKVTAMKNPYSSDDFLVENLPLSKGLQPCARGGLSCLVSQVESECPTTFQPQETSLFPKEKRAKVDPLFWT